MPPKKTIVEYLRQKKAARIARDLRTRRRAMYVTNNAGNIVNNAITYRPIRRNVAINIPTQTGLMRTWDATGLYDWFIKQNKTELRGLIHNLSPADRGRIIKLTTIRRSLKKSKLILEKESLIREKRIYNNVTRRELEAVDAALLVVTFWLFLFMAILSYVFNNPFPMSLTLIPMFGNAGTKKNRQTKKAKDMQRHIERLIDGIPFDGSNRAFLKYLDNVYAKNNDFFQLQYKYDTVIKKLRQLGLEEES